MSAPVLTLVLAALAGGCARERLAAQDDTRRDAVPLVVTVVAPSATVLPSSTAVTTSRAVPTEGAVHQQLRTARISALNIVHWSHPGFFHASVERPNSEGSAQVTLALALDQHPMALQKPLAVARLAWAIGLHVVPATIVRQVSTGEIGAAVANANDANMLAYLSAHAAIQNDGTIDALVSAPSCGDASTAWKTISRRDVDFDKAPEPRSWAQAVATLESSPHENKTLLRDYVEVLVLDYLTENGTHRGVLVDDATSTMMVSGLEGAFPSKHFPHIENRLLDALKPVLRFPRGLREALTRFDRARAWEVFMPGTFDTWILSPRTLMLIDERRLSLLTLLEARIGEYGEQAVLSL